MRDGWYELAAGAVVGGYRITRPLGRGGSGSVYEAERGGALVALKIMHDHDPSGTGRLRFDREAALVKKLDHPGVVRLLDHGHTGDGQPFIAFELVSGRSLGALLRPGRGLDIERVGAISAQILDALAAAHALGIVHRDIKPANVMLAAGDQARVLDFGLAKALFGDPEEVATITETGHRLGTPRYMSPEMARGQNAGPPGDVYAVALLIGEMIMGSPVIASNVQVDVLMQHASEQPIDLPEPVRRSPFGALLARALAKDPAARPTASAMRVAMTEALELHARALTTFGLDPAPATENAPAPWDEEATVLMAPDPMAATLAMSGRTGGPSRAATQAPARSPSAESRAAGSPSGARLGIALFVVMSVVGLLVAAALVAWR